MNETTGQDAGESTEQTAPNAPSLVRWVLGLTVLGLAVWAALAIHYRYEDLFQPDREPPERRPLRLTTTRRAAPTTRRVRRRVRRPDGPAPGRTPASRPAAPDMVSAITRALGAVDLPEMNRDPGRLAPPAKAVRLWARRQQTPGSVQEFGRYEFAGTDEEAASHYLGLLLDEGYDCHNDSRPADGPIRLEFRKDQTYAGVTLRKDPRNAKMVQISVVVLTSEE